MAIQDYFRMQNIFGGGDSDAGTPPLLPSRPVLGSADYDYGEQTPAMDAFQQAVLNPPERTRPSALRMIGTGLLSALQGSTEPGAEKRGFWGSLANRPFNVAQVSDILEMPYRAKLEDWKTRAGALQQAANIESQYPGRRALARQREAQARVIPQREERLGHEGEARIAQAQQRIEQNQQKIDHILSRQDLSDSEKLSLANQYRQEQIRLRGEIQSGQITQRGEIQTGQINLRGEIEKDIQNIRGKQRLEQIGAAGAEQRATKAVPSPGAGATSQLPTQERVRLQLKANTAVQEHPEWSEFISVNPNTGMVEIEPPGKTWYGRASGPDQDTYDSMLEYITGKKKATTAPPATKPTAKPTTAAKPIERRVRNKNTGEIRIQVSKDGGKTWSFK